jgi:hypothetical protein
MAGQPLFNHCPASVNWQLPCSQASVRNTTHLMTILPAATSSWTKNLRSDGELTVSPRPARSSRARDIRSPFQRVSCPPWRLVTAPVSFLLQTNPGRLSADCSMLGSSMSLGRKSCYHDHPTGRIHIGGMPAGHNDTFSRSCDVENGSDAVCGSSRDRRSD